MAQEVQGVMPGLVREGDDGYLMVSQLNHWKLIGAIQELKAENTALQLQNRELDARIMALEESAGLETSGVQQRSRPFDFPLWMIAGGLGLLLVSPGLMLGYRRIRMD